MLHIILMILKIVGILIACVVGLVLLALLLILFVPLRYRISVRRDQGQKELFRADVRISWLLHLINGFIRYPAKEYLRIRILFFTVFRLPKPERRREKKKQAAAGSKKPEITAGTGTAPGRVTAENQGMPEQGGDCEKPQFTGGRNKEDGADRESKAADGEETPSAEKIRRGLWSRIKEFFRQLLDFIHRLFAIFQNIRYTIRRICDRIRKITENISYYVSVLQGETFRAAFDVSKEQLKCILKGLRPDKFRLNLTAGTGDPAGTARILALHGILYPLIGNNVFIQPDFENQRLEGDLYMSGKLRIFTFLRAAFRLYRDRNIRKLLHLLQREE